MLSHSLFLCPNLCTSPFSHSRSPRSPSLLHSIPPSLPRALCRAAAFTSDAPYYNVLHKAQQQHYAARLEWRGALRRLAEARLGQASGGGRESVFRAACVCTAADTRRDSHCSIIRERLGRTHVPPADVHTPESAQFPAVETAEWWRC